MTFRHKDRANSNSMAGINVTPFVDVALVLLVIVMVTARVMPSNPRAVPVTLPRSSTGLPGGPGRLLVTLDSGGRVAVDGALLTDTQLLARVEGQETGDVVLAADGAVPHRRVVQVMDVLRRAGVRELGFLVSPEGHGSW
jgi:biopolymer transport protein ExbD